MKLLEERLGASHRTGAGAVYPILHQLEDEGLITSERRDGKTVFRLTEQGRRELTEKDEAVRQMWHRARRSDEWRSPFADAERLIREAFRTVTGRGASEAQIQSVREILERALRELEELGRRQ
jgi:DNA-binding PadR family transcriptional regulator